MGTVPIGTGEFRMIHSRVAWMFLPVERSITVSAPHLVAQRIFSTSSSMEEATALLPMLALIFTRKLRPMIIGSDSGWLMLAGMMARPRATSARTNSAVMGLPIADCRLPIGSEPGWRKARSLRAIADWSEPDWRLLQVADFPDSRMAMYSISDVMM